MPSGQLYTVTELARELGMTARAIRFYEDKGLITPPRAGTTRVYSAHDRARMILILRGKASGQVWASSGGGDAHLLFRVPGKLGIATIPSGSLILPAAIIGLVNVVYIARPIRGLVLSLRERAFIEAAVSQGASNVKIMRREVLPNLSTSLLVLAPIIVAQTVAFEAALSFLGAGVQAPTPSWGTMLNDGLDVLISAPHLTFAPGVMLVATVLSLNLIGDIVREALDPRGTLRAADRK